MDTSRDAVASNIRIATPISRLLNISAPKTCIICNSKAIRAHAISKSNILGKIARDGEVISVYTDISDITSPSFGLVGIGKVSTFSAFCSKHDEKLFKSLDEGQFTHDNTEQEFKMAFRAFARSNWFNNMQSNSCRRRIDAVATKDYAFIKKYMGIEVIYQSHVNNWIRSRDIADAELDASSELLAVLKHCLAEERWSQTLETRTIVLPNSYPISATGTGSINCDCTNTQSTLPKIFSYNIFPQDEVTYAVLSIPIAHVACLDKFIAGLMVIGGGDYAAALTRLLTQIPTEAIAIEPAYWSKLDDFARSSFIRLWSDRTSNKTASALEQHVSIFDSLALLRGD